MLVTITPSTGAISYVSPAFGGRVTDIFIVKDSGSLNLLELYDEIMADSGFKYVKMTYDEDGNPM